MKERQRLQLKTTDRADLTSDRAFKASPLQTGNFAVQQKSAATPASKAELWESYQQATKLTQNRSNPPVAAPESTRSAIQTKLSIGQPGDKYEQEADSVADRVMAMSEPAQVQREELTEEEELQMKPLADTISPLVQREAMPEEEELQMKPEDNVMQREELQEEEELQMKSLDNSIQREELPEEELQMKQSARSTQTATPDLESQLGSSKGGGNPLSDDVRSFMEPRFGADFSGVRVHTGSDAVQMNQGVNAQAFAHGSDIYFGAGKAPGKDALMAHELTHVVQQTGVRTTSLQQKPTIQRFGSEEHKSLGEKGSGGKSYTFGNDGKTVPFQLTHGDITMLSGDYFDPRDTRTNEQGIEEPVPDSLFRVAGTPSSSPGNCPGTQDEIIYAIKKINPQDPRFDPACTLEQPDGGIWSMLTFSDSVKKAVDDRYLLLAANNSEHFAAPHGAATPVTGNRLSAGGSYRALHEDAILRAFSAGQSRQNIGEGMAREAAADHFLTDNFAAGHLRTPRSDIREYWQKKYPLFFSNMKRKIALDVARYINDNTTNTATIAGTVSSIYDTIIKTVEEKTAGMPAFGFDDVVALVTHDFDNEEGLWVVNDLGNRWKTFGDGSLNSSDADNQTPQMAQLAVRIGCSDIEHAYALGTSNPGPYSTEWILNSVKAQAASPAMPGEKYAPEQIIPRSDVDKNNGTQNWQVDSIDTLWNAKIRSDLNRTYGQAITDSIRSGDIKDNLNGMAGKFPADEEVWKDIAGLGVETWLGTVHPKEAFINGFLEPIKTNPKAGLSGIIDFNPSEGQAWFNEDDAVMEESKKDIPGLTLNQRADRVRALIAGYTGEDEGERVIEIFQAAPASDRSQLYQLVEGHAWTGDWIEGLFTSDDDIWNALDRSQLSRLRNIINGQ